jgi:hypothetical protein
MFRQSQHKFLGVRTAKIILLIMCSVGFAIAEEFPRFELFADIHSSTRRQSYGITIVTAQRC